MRKIILAALAVIAIAACEKKEKTVESTEVVKETEVVKTPAPDTIVKTETEPEGTSVSVSNEGINVSSKNGDKKTKVEIDAKK